jgi:hypothetical protein
VVDHQAEGAAIALTPLLHLEATTTLGDEAMTVVQADTTVEGEGVTTVAEEMAQAAKEVLLNLVRTTAGTMLT